MENMTIDAEKKERFLLDKKNIYCESVRRAIEVQSHAARMMNEVDRGLTKKLVKSIEGNVDELNSALAELK